MLRIRYVRVSRMRAVAIAWARTGEQTRNTKAIAREARRLPAAVAFADGVNGMTPTTTWTRLAGRLGLDHNPLRRRSDVIEAWLPPAAIALFLALSPALGSAASAWAHAQNAAALHAPRSAHPDPAVPLPALPCPV